MKRLLAATAALLVIGGSASAATVSLDFVALAAGTPGDRGGVEGQTFTFGGLDVTLTSSHNAYLDDLSNGKPAGLGVCGTIGVVGGISNQCDPSNDDNITTGESVTLTFGQNVTSMTNFIFYDGNHNSLSTSSSTFDIGYNGSVLSERTFATYNGVSGSLTSITFAYGGTSADQFYLGGATVEYVAAVPLPAAMPMLAAGFGLLGVGAARRKRRKA
ncbi:hypothetical protein BCF46_1640 [Litoreibacter meonggei]|uniref:Secreted protein n=1 Tax=Litoreibacter meonggei TaxID=1049199 RepID=A0A497WRP0_9RHOB|nr:VPLPA-CTERM sorting domain-containing protein [Litoreibacter meonggei]RLJ59491.1 hypothetical protein BCF46_1640 [Litoreibacter meonggei]